MLDATPRLLTTLQIILAESLTVPDLQHPVIAKALPAPRPPSSTSIALRQSLSVSCDGRSPSTISSDGRISVWMSRWTNTSFTVAPCVQDRLSPVENNNDHDSPSAKGFTEVTEARTIRIMNDGQTSSKKEIDERLDCQPFPMFRIRPNIGSGLYPKNDPDISFDAPAQKPQIHCDVESTRILPYRFGSGKSSPFTSKQELNKLSSVLASEDHLSDTINFTTLGHKRDGNHDLSAILVGEKKLDNHSIAAKPATSVFGQNNACESLQDPFAIYRHLPILFGECSKKMQKRVAEGFPSSSHPPDASKAESSYHGDSTKKIPGCVHDMETMRICTTNSVEGLGGDPGAFSHTTHNLLFLKKTDASLSKEKQTIRESKASTKLKEGEGENNTENVQTPEAGLKNESPSETDAMYMDAFKWQNYLSGINSSPSNKDMLTGQTPPSYQQTIPSTVEEVGHGCPPITALPEVPVLPAVGISLDIVTSRTRSLDANPSVLKSKTDCPDVQPPLAIDPGSRWLKRLKLSSLDSLALGTKSSNSQLLLPTHEKGNKLFRKISSSSSSSETRSHKNRAQGEEEEIVSNYEAAAAVVLRNGESSSSSLESAKKGQDKLLSHPWIKRWCRDQTHQMKKNAAADDDAVVVCEQPHRHTTTSSSSSNNKMMEFNHVQNNKHFPSLGAMALMGKALSGVQPCKFHNTGSFVVWNNTIGF